MSERYSSFLPVSQTSSTFKQIHFLCVLFVAVAVVVVVIFVVHKLLDDELKIDNCEHNLTRTLSRQELKFKWRLLW